MSSSACSPGLTNAENNARNMEDSPVFNDGRDLKMHSDDNSCKQGGACLPLAWGGAPMPVGVQGGQATHDKDKHQYSLEGRVEQPACDCLQVEVLIAGPCLVQPCSSPYW